MPDITLPTTFVDATALDASGAQDNIYDPNFTPTSFEVMNGRLDIDNMPASPNITHDMVRRGAFAVGGTSGHTANLDFFRDHYPGDFTANTYSEAEDQGRVVVARTFDVPYNCEAVYLSWHVAIIVDAGFAWVRAVGGAGVHGVGDVDSDYDGEADDFTTPATHSTATGIDGNTLLILSVDGNPRREMSRRMFHGKNSVLGNQYYTAGGGSLKSMPTTAVAQDSHNDVLNPDIRVWSGHTIVDQTNASDFYPGGQTKMWAKGRHTAAIELVLGNWIHATSGERITAKHARFLTCRITAIPVR